MGSSSSKPQGHSAYPASRRPTTHSRNEARSNGSSGSGVPHGRVIPPTPPPPAPADPTPPLQTTQPTSHSSTNMTTIVRPGAYSITNDSSGQMPLLYRVQIPLEVLPGQEFIVNAGSRLVRVRCPLESRGGDYLSITIPPEPIMRREALDMAVLTCALPGVEGGGGAVRMNDDVARANAVRDEAEGGAGRGAVGGAQPPQQQQGPITYMVTVPAGISSGMQFIVNVEGQNMMVTCPPGTQAGMNLRITPPAPSPTVQGTSLDRPPPPEESSRPPMPQFQQMYEVVVPAGVYPGQSFTILADGQRVLVTCPPNVRPGMKVRFELPRGGSGGGDQSGADDVKPLEYESIKDGWARTLRVTDMRFVWVRMNEDGGVVNPENSRFDIKHSAYTRKMTFLEGNDKRMRTGTLSLVPANKSSVESCVMNGDLGSETVVTYAEIAAAHRRGSYDEKVAWFQEMCRERLRVKWTDGHVRIYVRRGMMLNDSIEAVMSLGRTDLRKYWRFEFMGEVGIDAGGVAREWFQLVTEEVFNPDMGLWLPSASNQMAMRINPASEISCPEDHLIHFRFLGRVMGKALFDGQLVAGHMVRHMYKHILGWPVMFEDLKLPDENYYNSLKDMLEMNNVEDLSVDFTFLENDIGEKRPVDLIEGGGDVTVTNDNLPEFLEANLKYHLMDRVKPQLTELLLGFYDVIPESLLTIFDFQELELLMCGVPTMDIDDWMANTSYTGLFHQTGANTMTCQWFWEVVRDEFNQETRARLLQFVTGTSGVPSRGFSVLQGNDNSIRLFCLHGINKKESFYPRSHTCFNRLDLPVYDSKEELREKLKIAITTSATGFDIE
ncbi:hypothetical protein ACHAXA_011474 [Cyclostephanos tholiformis]|uniref:HECT-type E3 ubiquitin transferase n=1 Tax=Cyclostephanos tholiformis TaxID=382380 RepID=A0ABD3SEF5_9STRA